MKLKLLSSLEKIFFDFPEDTAETNAGSMLKNEIHSFQLAYQLEDSYRDPYDWKVDCNIDINSPIKDCITIYNIGYVPSMMPAYPTCKDEDYITKNPGMFPDTMLKIRDGKICVHNYRTRAIWVSIEPNGKFYGEYPVTIKIYNDDNSINESITYKIKIINESLPKLNIKNTCWFHGDCIAKLHNVEVDSKEYTEILKKYLDVYMKFGHNMILTPIFTPPLDTEVGGERPTNQLVKVYIENGRYRFDFSLLKEWIDICRIRGIEYFEISHLFTQWGAYYTPKIIAMVDGEYKRIFGWDVESLSEKYREFLDAFLPELVAFLKEQNIYENCMFHISDEPKEEHEQQYAAVLDLVLKYVEKNKLMDAISDYVFYEKGYITNPVVCNDHIKPFLKNSVNNLWTYYCCVQGDKVANRFMSMPSYRNRILGYQLYKYNISGFLQWGFNFWFTQFSKSVVNPYYVTDAGVSFPSGDAFLVYPLDECGDVVTSIRLCVFNEAMQDMRALTLLENLTSRSEAEKLLLDIDGFDEYPRNTNYILNLREKINEIIEQYPESE